MSRNELQLASAARFYRDLAMIMAFVIGMMAVEIWR
jgi:hypothetical protein